MTPPHKKKLLESAKFYSSSSSSSSSNSTNQLNTTETTTTNNNNNNAIVNHHNSLRSSSSVSSNNIAAHYHHISTGGDSSKRMRVAENSSSLQHQHCQPQFVNHQYRGQQQINHQSYLIGKLDPSSNTGLGQNHHHHNNQHTYQTAHQQQQQPGCSVPAAAASNNFFHHHIHHHQQNNHRYSNINTTTTPSAEMYFFGGSKNDNHEFSTKKCRTFFRQYAEQDSESIGPDGIEKLCHDLGVRPEDSIMLALSWKLQAKVMGIYTLDEWLHGMSELRCDNIQKLRSKLPLLRTYLENSCHFRYIYRYSYEFAKEPEQRCIDVETAKQMLAVLFQSRWPLLPLFIEFLNESNYRGVNKDQYYNILDFVYSVNADLNNYDENGAWPVMLDEFVEWCRTKKGFKRINNGDGTNSHNNGTS